MGQFQRGGFVAQPYASMQRHLELRRPSDWGWNPNWNPIEHRLFSEISKNWAGQPLTNMETMLNFIRTTKTETGLTVSAYLIPENYDTGINISDRQMRQLNLVKHDTLGLWNYTVRPAPNGN